jgi:hypothetical protein
MGNGGTNDVVILMSIMFFLIGLGAIAPIIQTGSNQIVTQSTGVQVSLINVSGIADIGNVNDVSLGFWAIASSIFQALFLWFGWFPWWLTLIHVVLRIVLVVILYRLFRSGAG